MYIENRIINSDIVYCVFAQMSRCSFGNIVTHLETYKNQRGSKFFYKNCTLRFGHKNVEHENAKHLSLVTINEKLCGWEFCRMSSKYSPAPTIITNSEPMLVLRTCVCTCRYTRRLFVSHHLVFEDAYNSIFSVCSLISKDNLYAQIQIDGCVSKGCLKSYICE